MTVNVKITGKVPENPILVDAFPSKGYVSTLAANQMIKKLEMEQIGYISADKLEAVAVVHDGKPMHPIRVYTKDNIVLLFSELMVPFTMVHEFTAAIGEWVDEIKPKSAILLASMPGVDTEKEHEIMTVSTDESVKPKLEKLELKPLDEGVLTGMSSSLMIHCCNQKIPSTSLMVETSYIPDVLAAASLLKILGELLDVDIEVDELAKAGHEIEKKFKNTLEQLHKGQQDYNEIHSSQGMYR